MWNDIKKLWKGIYEDVVAQWSACWKSSKTCIIEFVKAIFHLGGTLITIVVSGILDGILGTGRLVCLWILDQIKKKW